MEWYCLSEGIVAPAAEVRWEELDAEAIYRLDVAGNLCPEKPEEWETDPKLPALQAEEGILAYSGGFCIDPLEIQVEFLKAGNAKEWLEALVIRHFERMHRLSEEIWALAGIKEEDKWI